MKYGRNNCKSDRARNGSGFRIQATSCLTACLVLFLALPVWSQAPASTQTSPRPQTAPGSEAAPGAQIVLTPQTVVSPQGGSSPQSAWKVDIVDPGQGHDVGRTSNLVIDKQGNFHIIYLDETSHGLLYAYRARGDKRWYSMSVIAKGASYPSMAVDTQGHPHVVYVAGGKKDADTGLGYAYFDGRFWHSQVVDPQGMGYFTSIQLDSQGHPRISYYHYHDQTGAYSLHLKYAYFDGKNWFIQTVDPRVNTGKYNSIAVDGTGNPHIAYSHVGWGDLLYAHWDGKEWKFSDVDSRRKENHYLGYGPSIAVDSAGNPHIAYFDSTKAAVKYAWMDNGSWKTEIADSIGAHGELDRVSLKIDNQNQPHVAYYDAGAGVLKYARRDDKGWHIEVVDQDGNVGDRPSLCLAPDGQVYISYYDVTNHALRFASRVPGAPLPPAATAVASTTDKKKDANKKVDADKKLDAPVTPGAPQKE